MAEILISDASKKVDVEAHVLRYWEEELELSIPRTEMGHRYYTEFHIRLFQQVKQLKEKGYQLKAIKAALLKSMERNDVIPGEVLETDVLEALQEAGVGEDSGEAVLSERTDGGTPEERREIETPGDAEQMERFRQLMTHMVGRAMEENSEKISQDISSLVYEKLTKEIEYLMRVSDEREEERFKRLDESIRACQRENLGRAEAAASLSVFPLFRFRKKKFGRNGNKI